MAGFRNVRALADSLTDDGKHWISTFRKVPAASATIAGQWFDYAYAAGNPIPNYYAASPLESAVLESDKGIIVPRMEAGSQQYLHRVTAMAVAASATSVTSDAQPLMLMDYLLYYPFIDMDAAGEDQVMTQAETLPRYEDGIGLRIMMVAQSPTIGGGRFTVTYVGTDDVEYTTDSLYCAAAQPAGALTCAVGAAAGVSPFLPLAAGVKGVKSIVSCNFSVANGGLCALVIVRPLDTHYVMEASRRTTSGTLESFGDATEREAMRLRGGMVEIKDGAFLGFIGQGSGGSLASAPLVGTIETVWS
jgi:hypothetical protein